MKEIVLQRIIHTNCPVDCKNGVNCIHKRGTLGVLLDGTKKLAVTLEHSCNNNAPKKSCIPAGKYRVVRDLNGKFKFWKLVNVAGRTSIEIHNGNFIDDTEGCILLGEAWSFYEDKLMITKSLVTLKSLLTKLPNEFDLIIKN